MSYKCKEKKWIKKKWIKNWLKKCRTSARKIPAGQFRDGMMTSSNRNIFRVTGHLCGECTGDRWIPRTKAIDAELLRLNKRLSKQSWGWWFETLSCPLWRHCNVVMEHKFLIYLKGSWCHLVHMLSKVRRILNNIIHPTHHTLRLGKNVCPVG